jgi:hypothetical protein
MGHVSLLRLASNDVMAITKWSVSGSEKMTRPIQQVPLERKPRTCRGFKVDHKEKRPGEK